MESKRVSDVLIRRILDQSMRDLAARSDVSPGRFRPYHDVKHDLESLFSMAVEMDHPGARPLSLSKRLFFNQIHGACSIAYFAYAVISLCMLGGWFKSNGAMTGWDLFGLIAQVLGIFIACYIGISFFKMNLSSADYFRFKTYKNTPIGHSFFLGVLSRFDAVLSDTDKRLLSEQHTGGEGIPLSMVVKTLIKRPDHPYDTDIIPFH